LTLIILGKYFCGANLANKLRDVNTYVDSVNFLANAIRAARKGLPVEMIPNNL